MSSSLSPDSADVWRQLPRRSKETVCHKRWFLFPVTANNSSLNVMQWVVNGKSSLTHRNNAVVYEQSMQCEMERKKKSSHTFANKGAVTFWKWASKFITPLCCSTPCIYMYIHIVRVYIHIYVYTHTQIYIYVCVRKYINIYLYIFLYSSKTLSCGLQPRQALSVRKHKTKDFYSRRWDPDQITGKFAFGVVFLLKIIILCFGRELAGGFIKVHRRRGVTSDIRGQTDRPWWRPSLSDHGESVYSKPLCICELTGLRSRCPPQVEFKYY